MQRLYSVTHPDEGERAIGIRSRRFDSGKRCDRLGIERSYVGGNRIWRGQCWLPGALLLILLAADGGKILRAARAESQQNANEETSQEVVVNLAAGRVGIVVAKDQIVIGALQNPIESDAIPPQIVELSGRRAGILLGAVQWRSTTSKEYLAQLERELPRLRSLPGRNAGPHLDRGSSEAVATDIEQTGLGVYKRLDELVRQFHARLDMKSGEPLLQVVVAGYVPDYGPDIWVLNYSVEQEMLRRDYWTSRALRPHYTQVWPPEKGAPQSLMEFCYPAGSLPGLLDQFRLANSLVARMTAGDAQMRAVQEEMLSGPSTKVKGEEAIQFLRATLDALAKPGEVETIAVVDQQNGFGWVLKPPAPKEPENKKPRPPGVPSLEKPTG
jgi:hypothetical protein